MNRRRCLSKVDILDYARRKGNCEGRPQTYTAFEISICISTFVFFAVAGQISGSQTLCGKLEWAKCEADKIGDLWAYAYKNVVGVLMTSTLTRNIASTLALP